MSGPNAENVESIRRRLESAQAALSTTEGQLELLDIKRRRLLREKTFAETKILSLQTDLRIAVSQLKR